MTSTREERMQQRLRGAQRREVKEVDFGLAFPVAQPQPDPAVSPPASPQPDLLFPSIEPITQDDEPLKKEQTFGGAQAQSSRSGNIDANISAKRRKLNTDGARPPTRGTRSTNASDSTDVYSLPEDEPRRTSSDGIPKAGPRDDTIKSLPVPAEGPGSDQVVSRLHSRATRTPPLSEVVSEEITESPADAPGSGHRARIVDSIRAIHSQLQPIQNSSPTSHPGTLTPRTNPKRRQPTPGSFGPELLQNQRDRSGLIAPASDELDDLSPTVLSRKRKSLSKGSSAVRERRTSTPNVDEEDAEAIGDLEAAAILKKNRSRRISRNIQLRPSPDLDAVVDVAPQHATKTRIRKSKNISSPSIQRQPKKSSSTIQKPRQLAKTAKLRGGSPIPVTIHRFTQQPQYEEDESDADILNSEIPYAKRSGVNSVDVLSQVCQEIIGTGLETLENGGRNADDPSLRREYKTKWNALRIFGEELQTRLLAHTINLDNVYSLEKRVREEHTKKQALRDEILHIRAERQQVAVRMDEIRIRHEDEASKAQERDALNSTAYDIELAIDSGRNQSQNSRNRGSEMTGIEVLLTRVARQISNKGDSGGVLKQVKEFNGFLERAALALESRDA